MSYDEGSENEGLLEYAHSEEEALEAARVAKYGHFKVFTPRFILFLFTMMNLFTYYDRGVMSASIDNISTDDSIAGKGNVLSNTNSGLMVSIFMAGFLTTSPVFVALGGVLSAKLIILIGLVAWSVACVMTGLSHGYWMIMLSRACVGIGEAAYAGFSVTIIDNIAPAATRTLWIGTFYSMIATGTAVGMAAGGMIGQHASIGSFGGWRVAFLSEVFPMFFVIAGVALMPSVYNTVKAKKEGEDGEEGGDQHVGLFTAVKSLAQNGAYVALILGYATYTFVLGAIAVWAITMLIQGPLRFGHGMASVTVGGMTAFSGLVGSLLGGVAVDKMGGSQGYRGVFKCCLFSSAAVAVSLPSGIIALMAESVGLFVPFFFISVFTLFMVTAPTNTSILSVVPRRLRTYAITFSIFAIHLFGDVPSPIIAGRLSDAFNNGCSDFNHNHTACELVDHCVWNKAPNDHSSPFCSDLYQLRNALVIVFACMAVALPLWGTVAFLVYGKQGTVDEEEEARKGDVQEGFRRADDDDNTSLHTAPYVQ